MQEEADAVSGFRIGAGLAVERGVYSGVGEMSRILGVAKGDETVAQRHGSNGKSAVRAPEMMGGGQVSGAAENATLAKMAITLVCDTGVDEPAPMRYPRREGQRRDHATEGLGQGHRVPARVVATEAGVAGKQHHQVGDGYAEDGACETRLQAGHQRGDVGPQ